jgi:hypothetical protein
MTTCRDVISYALRQAKVYAPGETPTAEDAADGLVALQSLYDGYRSNGMFGLPFYEEELPDTIITDEGDEREPWELSLCIVADIPYVRDHGDWKRLTGLSLDDEPPLAQRGMSGLAASLATSGGFAAMFTSDIDPRIDWLARNFNGGLVGKFGSEQAKYAAVYF